MNVKRKFAITGKKQDFATVIGASETGWEIKG